MESSTRKHGGLLSKGVRNSPTPAAYPGFGRNKVRILPATPDRAGVIATGRHTRLKPELMGGSHRANT